MLKKYYLCKTTRVSEEQTQLCYRKVGELINLYFILLTFSSVLIHWPFFTFSTQEIPKES